MHHARLRLGLHLSLSTVVALYKLYQWSSKCPDTCTCDLQDTVIEEDKEFVTQYFDMPDTDFADMERMSPWLLRIELNREMLTDKGLNMSRIADTITSEFGEEMSVIFTDDNAPKHILRVGFLVPQLLSIRDCCF